MQFTLKRFNELTTLQLYEILKLRIEVFVVEQKCWYQDLDDKDKEAIHLMGWENNQLCCYARILASGVSYKDEASIGRVVTTEQMRNNGSGQKLMKEAINQCQMIYPACDIMISAQSYLINFYKKFGFITIGEQYLEDNIPHIGMLLKQEG
jgi:ElaA protein